MIEHSVSQICLISFFYKAKDIHLYWECNSVARNFVQNAQSASFISNPSFAWHDSTYLESYCPSGYRRMKRFRSSWTTYQVQGH